MTGMICNYEKFLENQPKEFKAKSICNNIKDEYARGDYSEKNELDGSITHWITSRGEFPYAHQIDIETIELVIEQRKDKD